MLKTMNKDFNTSSIYTTHSLLEAQRVCDKIMILIFGQISCIGKIDYLKNQVAGYHIKVSSMQNLKTPQVTEAQKEEIIDFLKEKSSGMESRNFSQCAHIAEILKEIFNSEDTLDLREKDFNYEIEKGGELSLKSIF